MAKKEEKKEKKSPEKEKDYVLKPSTKEDTAAFMEKLRKRRMESGLMPDPSAMDIPGRNYADIPEATGSGQELSYASSYPPLETQRLLVSEDENLRELFSQYAYPWQILPFIKDFILRTQKKLPKEEYNEIAPGVFVHKTAEIAESASLTGPCIIGPETSVRHCAFIRGSVYVAASCVMGNSCEFKNSILCEKVQVPHFNYVGDSILGSYSHMGAGSITSNVKSDKTRIHIKFNLNMIDTGLRKFGAVLGNHCEIGCNTVLNPGSVVGQNSRIYPLTFVRGYVQPDSILKNDGRLIGIV